MPRSPTPCKAVFDLRIEAGGPPTGHLKDCEDGVHYATFACRCRTSKPGRAFHDSVVEVKRSRRALRGPFSI
jgi:hypothetical protein